MRIGVEEVVLEDLLEVGVEQHIRHLRPVDAGRGDGVVVRDLDGVDILQREHTHGGAAPGDAGHAHTLAVREVGREGLGVPALGEIVDLAMHRVG